jgi:hypothetical protein
MLINDIDVRENDILARSKELLSLLLVDQSRSLLLGKCSNIIWGTDTYSSLGHKESDYILIEDISGENGNVIQPRIKKSKAAQKGRSREKAEVFTPSWLCNKQNNLVDTRWFGRNNVFNIEIDKGWKTISRPIPFPTKDGKHWIDYVTEQRMEISCGEAPYLVSRYDTITGAPIPIDNRIGLLDRKLRVVSENATTQEEWHKWAEEAYKSIYAFEWQGDNLLLARENLLFTYIDAFQAKFHEDPRIEELSRIASIISWNIWQMDGLKAVIPSSCHEEIIKQEGLLFDSDNTISKKCPGCETDDINRHNGIACYIMDWEKETPVLFRSLLKS